MSVPSTPNIKVRPKASNQTLEFFWGQDAPDGGSPITSYVLFDGTTSNVLTDGWGYYRVTGLTNGTSYSYSLAASNANGLSPYNSFRTVQPGNKPQVPSSITVSSITGTTNYLVSWYTPSNVGSTTNILGTVLKGYVLDSNSNVLLRGPSTITAQIQGGNAGAFQQYTMGLYSNYMWRILVRPVNDPGYGPNTAYSAIINLIPPTGFSPSSIASLTYWVDAADITTISTNSAAVVQTWLDKSGSNNNTLFGANRPTYISTGGTYIDTANGNQQFLAPSSCYAVTSGGSATIFITYADKKNAGTYQDLLGTTGSPFTENFYVGLQRPGGEAWYSLGRTSGAQAFTSTFSTIVYVTRYTHSTNLGTLHINGSNVLSSFSLAVSPTGNLQFSATGTDFANCKFNEVLVYRSNLTTIQRQTSEAYLAWKWGLSTFLPTWHPFYTRAPIASDSNLDFSPSSIATMAIWLDANDTSSLTLTASNTVTAIRDKSGAGNNSSNYSGTITLSTINSRQTMYFSSAFMNGPISSLSGSNVHFFAVSRGGARVVSFSAPGQQDYQAGGLSLLMNYTNPMNIIRGGTTLGLNGLTADLPYITMYRETGSNVTLAANISTSSNYSGTYGSLNLTTWCIARNAGNTGDTGNTLTGQFGELLFYRSSLNTLQQQQAEGYLAWKWGLQGSLPSTHLFFYRPPTIKDTFTSFSPSSIGGIQLWLDASDRTTYTLSGSNVISWNSKGYSTVVLSSITVKSGGTYPTFTGSTINGLSTISFDTNSLLRQANVYDGVKNMFWVARQRPSPTNVSLFGHDSVNDWLGFPNAWANTVFMQTGIQNASSLYVLQNSTIQSTFVNTPFFSTNSLGLLSVYNITGSTRWQGIAYDRTNAGRGWAGDLAEILVFSNALSTYDRQTVEGYLAWKWGLQNDLPVGHPFRNFSTCSLSTISTTNTF